MASRFDTMVRGRKEEEKSTTKKERIEIQPKTYLKTGCECVVKAIRKKYDKRVMIEKDRQTL
jgi:ribosomal protein L7Ae-like RNA K-turn-binding protein